MRWILCGKNDAAVECLELLVRHGDDVWVVGTAADDGTDGWQRSLRRAAGHLGVRFEQPPRINDPGIVERLRAFGARALLSIQYDQILRGNLFRRIGCPCLNFHFALLPRHRGVAPIAWAVAEGDTEAGVTLHHMIEDIDAGAVIAQRRVSIEPAHTAREVYDGVSRATVDLFREQYPFPAKLLATRIEQDPGEACYHRAGDLDFSQRRIEWSRPAVELQRWIRAMIFPPLQYPETIVAGRVLHVTRIAGALGAPVAAVPGVVVGRSHEWLEVAGAGGTIRIAGMADPADPGTSATAIMASVPAGAQMGAAHPERVEG